MNNIKVRVLGTLMDPDFKDHLIRQIRSVDPARISPHTAFKIADKVIEEFQQILN